MLFLDGNCFRKPDGELSAGNAVVFQTEQGFETVEQGWLEGAHSAQRALIATLRWAEGKKVTIYTDSAYVFGAVHVELGQWFRAGFLTATNKTIKHGDEMKELVLLLPDDSNNIKVQGT